MKAVQTFAVGNGSAKKFQADDIITQRVHLPDGLELTAVLKQLSLQIKTMDATIKTQTAKIKELEDKLDSIETEEA